MFEKSLKLSFATFNSERFWRDRNTTLLPSFFDSQAQAIVEIMDEVQYSYCDGNENLIISRVAMNSTHKDYLSQMGYHFSNSFFPMETVQQKEFDTSKNICDLILQHQNTITELDVFKSNDNVEIHPFSILPNTHLLQNALYPKNILPNSDVVRKINSKLFSNQLEKEMTRRSRGNAIFSSQELKQTGEEMLFESPFLIKDTFGVSGSGNILVSKKNALSSIVKHLYRQEQTGKCTELILEPFLEKKKDFSCQFQINPNGMLTVTSVQIMENNGFKFSGILTADKQFIDFLEEKNYFRTIEDISQKIHSEGYFGPVCLDSMILNDDTIVPIIEINARKSMGLLSERLSLFLKKFDTGINCKIMTQNFTMKIPVYFEDFFNQLQKENILFNIKKPKGIFPISANTMDINCKLQLNTIIKGRLYYAICYNTIDDLTGIQKKFKKIMNHLHLKTI